MQVNFCPTKKMPVHFILGPCTAPRWPRCIYQKEQHNIQSNEATTTKIDILLRNVMSCFYIMNLKLLLYYFRVLFFNIVSLPLKHPAAKTSNDVSSFADDAHDGAVTPAPPGGHHFSRASVVPQALPKCSCDASCASGDCGPGSWAATAVRRPPRRRAPSRLTATAKRARVRGGRAAL